MAITINAPQEIINSYNRIHGRKVTVKNAYDQSVKDLVLHAKNIGVNKNHLNTAFAFPKADRKAQALLNRFFSFLVTALDKGITKEWDAANATTGKWLDDYFANTGLPAQVIVQYKDPHNEALNAFKERPELKTKIHNYVVAFKSYVELLCDVIVGQVYFHSAFITNKNLLEDPNRLFAVIRQKYGVAFLNKLDIVTPGKGVYKSPLQNIDRLFKFQQQSAYRKAQHLAWKDLPFVAGINIRLTHAHTDCPVCNAMQGDYPPDFFYTGHHVGCNCLATPMLLEGEEKQACIATIANGKRYTPANKITTIPASAKAWWVANKNRAAKRNYPVFVKNNPQYFEK